MRSLIIYKQNDGNIYHCDLDDNTAIGVDIQVFDPAKPDVSRVNCSNEFSVPKTRNNIAIFDGIFNPGQIISENKYECDYFVDNHRLISGIVYLTGSTSDRITMFIYDKHSILAELKSIKFSDFEKEFLDSSYYDMADWPREKNAPGYTQEGDMTNCFPVVLHPQPITSLPKDLFKESCVSLYQSQVAMDIVDVKQKLTEWVNGLDPLKNLCTLWNAIISKWSMDFLNYNTPTTRITSSTTQQYYTEGISRIWNIDRDVDRAFFSTLSSRAYPTIASKKKMLMSNEAYFILGIDPENEGNAYNMYIGGYPLANRTKVIGIDSWSIDDDLSSLHMTHTLDKYDLTVKEDKIIDKIEFIMRRIEGWADYTHFVEINGTANFTSISELLYCFGVNNSGSVGTQGYIEDDDYVGTEDMIMRRPRLMQLLAIIIYAIHNLATSEEYYADGVHFRKGDLLASIDMMTQANYQYMRSLLDELIYNIPKQGNDGYWGAMQADGASVYSDRMPMVSLNRTYVDTTEESWEDDKTRGDCVCYASNSIISTPPSINVTMLPVNPTTEQRNKFYMFQKNYLFSIFTIFQGGVSPTITQDELQKYRSINISDIDRPPFKFIPTSSSDDDSFTTNAYGTVTKLTMTMAKLDGDTLQYNSGSLYASSYSILTKLASRFNAKIEKDIEWSNWYTNFPDLVITTNSDYWWWDINQAGEQSKTSSPRNKTMYDWLMMFCKVHSLVPVIDNNYNQWDSVTETTYTTRLRFRKYGQQETIDMLDADMFDLRLGSEWKGDGGYQNSVNYIDFSSTEEGLDKRAISNPIIISNPALNNEPQTLYTNGVHRMKVAIPNNKPNIWQTKGSEDFQYIYAMSADGNDITSPMVYNIAESEIELDAVIGSNTYTMKDADNNTAHMWYIPNVGQYVKQPEVDVTFLNRLVGNPYPIVYEVEAYASLDDLMDVFINREGMSVYRFKDLQGYYYITKVEGINGYNRKSPVKLTLIRYK